MNRNWRLWTGLIISALAGALALRGIDLGRVAASVSAAQYLYLVPATLAMLAYLLLRSLRWRVLLGFKVSFARCFWITNVGYLVSNVLPFRLGDPARAVAIGLTRELKTSTALSTVVVERVLDMLMVVFLLAATLPIVGGGGWMRDAGLAAGWLAVAAVVVLVGLSQRPEWAKRAVSWVSNRLLHLRDGPWLNTVDGLLEGLAPLRSPRHLLPAIMWSVLGWGFVTLYYFFILAAFLDQPTLLQGGFLTSGVGLAMAVPSAPGAVGVFHSFARYALELPFGIPTEQAVAIALAAHAFQYVLMCLLGVVGLMRQNVSLSRLRASARATMEEEAPG